MANGHDQYVRAQKLANKAVAEARSRGLSPVLPTLQDVLEDLDQNTTINLGVKDIPLTKIRGTVSKSRAISFACNFMPLMSADTEFASKWKALCAVQMEEGIESPIQVIEYMGLYYVQEGNKRVSVFKALGAVSIRAEVSRLLPRKRDTKQYRLYQEYMDFQALTDINYLWMSEEGNFNELLTVLDMKDREDWLDEERSSIFRSSYHLFRKAFKAHQGDSLNMTTGDAFLRFVKVMNYYSIYKNTEEQLQKDLDTLWPELVSMSSNNPIELVREPAEDLYKRSFFGWREALQEFIPKKKIRAAFIHADIPILSNWTRLHERGRLDLEQALAGHIETDVYYNIPTDPVEGCKKLQEIAEKGYDYIFTTSQRYLSASLRAAVRCPETQFLNCSVHVPYRHLKTYFGRMFEAKMLSGLIAGSMTKTNKVGFIINLPTAAAISTVNGFAMGVRMVNPYAKVYLDWTGKVDEENPNPEDRLLKLGVDLISSQDMLTSHDRQNHFGLCKIDPDGTFTNLATSVWNWGIFYQRLIRSLTINHENGETEQAINFWWGMSAGVVDIALKEEIPMGIRLLVETIKRDIISDGLPVFSGEIKDQAGNVRIKAGSVMTSEEILTMDYLVDNVVGIIPEVEQLKPDTADSLYPVII